MVLCELWLLGDDELGGLWECRLGELTLMQ